ncbi:MAG: diguanylate cyclase [Hyphomicrobiales bacterium]
MISNIAFNIKNIVGLKVIYLVVYGLICLVLLFSPQSHIFNLRVSDLVQLAKHTPVSQDILIVDIDRKTVDNVGAYPTPNGFYAKLLNRLHEAGVKKIYLDQLLAVETNAADDQALADTLTKIGPEKIGIPGYNPTTTKVASKPFEKFVGKTTMLGVHFFPDSDNRYRKLTTQAEKNTIYTNPARWLNGEKSTRSVTINQHFDLKSINRISAWDLLSLPHAQLANKTILIGTHTSLRPAILTYTNHTKIDRSTLIALAYESVRTQTNVSELSSNGKFILLLAIGIFSIGLSIALNRIKNKRIGRILFAGGGIGLLIYVNLHLLNVYHVYLPIFSQVMAFGIAKLVYSAFRIRLIEMLFELYSGDLSAEEAWAWQTVARQKEPLVLMGFKGLKRWNDATTQANFFGDKNPHAEENINRLQKILGEENKANLTIKLQDMTGYKVIQCSFPFADIPLVRLDDISAEQAEKKRLETALHTDTLTGSLNRAGFFNAAKAVGSRYTTIMMDLNGFKAANDTLGHAAGDELLKIAAVRFASVLSEDQTLGRLGGDEFCIMLPNINLPASAKHICDLLENSLKGKIELSGGLQADISVAAGYAIAVDGETIDETLDRADKQMYKRKIQIKSVPEMATRNSAIRKRA